MNIKEKKDYSEIIFQVKISYYVGKGPEPIPPIRNFGAILLADFLAEM